MGFRLDKKFVTNFVALLLVVAGWWSGQLVLLMIGLFALSGAVTNWLAIYMLFERVPGLIGSGVIPARFSEFKSAIKNLMMEQFFTQENIDRFLQDSSGENKIELAPVIQNVDLTPAYDRLVEVIMNSSFGSMLAMFGGAEKLEPLREPFITNLQASLIEIAARDEVKNALQAQIDQPEMIAQIQHKIEQIVDSRLEELTPQMVKQMVQQLIDEHLGWLVVWGGVFGALIGAFSVLVLPA
ncbi:DUF445 domain-containing protein [Thiomicrorhabdus xiamenensis]|uniref:DUF445 domain-containing protein n=1 Tax=Thiomicrorhabdus xiamenensis TaxID=2739063 RepID=A0A7D4TFM4_9GAMM|nr:DUF445 domain-containing protein [Thiomicrorhabdus xiamenensis]QKI89008.1 DUF445 domain-containing protein [Thiomicrorhabdus xiamenensis]